MFWTFIRWGGTLVIIALVLAAAFLSSHSDTQDPAAAAPAVTPADAPPPAKNFNL